MIYNVLVGLIYNVLVGH